MKTTHTNELLAKNVKALRESKSWTQQHLADTAGILLRTVQRVEKGDGASLETLGALANAFDVEIELLKADIEGLLEKIRQDEEAFRKDHYIVEVAPVTCSAHLERIGASDGYLMHCASEEDAIRDAFSELSSELQDMSEVWNDVGREQHREWVKAAYGRVEQLNRLGMVVSLGHGTRNIGRTEIRTLYVVAWPKGQEKTMIASPKDP
jgi:transcriptional regulator with XRE-family HTH domain